MVKQKPAPEPQGDDCRWCGTPMVRSAGPTGISFVNLCSHCDEPHGSKDCVGCVTVDGVTDWRRL